MIGSHSGLQVIIYINYSQKGLFSLYFPCLTGKFELRLELMRLLTAPFISGHIKLLPERRTLKGLAFFGSWRRSRDRIGFKRELGSPIF